jgi:hypothetical protein
MVFEIGVLKRIHGRKAEGLAGGLGKLRCVELPNSCSSDIVRAIKSWKRRPMCMQHTWQKRVMHITPYSESPNLRGH